MFAHLTALACILQAAFKSRPGQPNPPSPLHLEPLEQRSLLSAAVPHFDHIVVAIEENKAYSQIINSPQAPFINSLAAGGALFTRSYAVSHPSQPNYLALFSGSTQGITNDNDPGILTAPNLAQELRQQHLTFAGYTDGVVPKHNPWLAFSSVPRSANQPMSRFPSDLSRLPTVSFIAPNQLHDMHDGTIAQGDRWLSAHLGRYARWAKTHNSLLIVTFDEDDSAHGNRIATIFYGAGVQPGRYAQRITHYNVLRTIEASYNLPPIARSATAAPITAVWAPIP